MDFVEKRMNKLYSDYVQDCINALEKMSSNNLLNGLSELQPRTEIFRKKQTEKRGFNAVEVL
jgi:hypothetical protein